MENTSEKSLLGIDVAKTKVDVVLWAQNQSHHKIFENNVQGFKQLKGWLVQKKAQNIHACMEATGIYGRALAQYLYQESYTVSVVNPLCIKAFGMSQLKRNKTDKADAQTIAQFCAHMNPAPWEPLPVHVEELTAYVRRLDQVSQLLQDEYNHAESSDPITAKYVRKTVRHLESQKKTLLKEIQLHIEKHPDLKAKKELLETIPGVGEITIPKILTFLSQPEKFQHAKQVAAFLGLTPRQCSSGSSVHGKTTLSRMGHSDLRKALYLPTLTAIRYNPVIRAFYERLLRAGKMKMVAIGAAMRKLVHMIYGVLKKQKPFNPDLAPKMESTA